MPGISMSVTTQSNASSPRRVRASWASLAGETWKPASSSSRRSISRVTIESSTSSTRTRRSTMRSWETGVDRR